MENRKTPEDYSGKGRSYVRKKVDDELMKQVGGWGSSAPVVPMSTVPPPDMARIDPSQMTQEQILQARQQAQMNNPKNPISAIVAALMGGGVR